MARSLFAVVPVTLGLWSREGELSADCLNDLHSFDKEVLQRHGCRPYQNNTLQLRTTSDSQFCVSSNKGVAAFDVVLVDVDFFKRGGFFVCDEDDFIVIKDLTAKKLLEIVSEVHRIARKS